MPSFPRLLGPARSIVLAVPEIFADLEDIKASEIQDALDAGQGAYELTCAMEEGSTSVGADDPDTDDTLLMCDTGQRSRPTFDNVAITLGFMKDARRETADVAGVAWNLLKVKGIPYILIDRIGYAPGTAFAEDQEVDYYSIETDNSIRVLGDREAIRYEQTPKFRGIYSPSHTLAA